MSYWPKHHAKEEEIVPHSALKRTVRSGELGKRSDLLRLGKPCLLPLPATCLFLTKSDMGGSQKRNPMKSEKTLTLSGGQGKANQNSKGHVCEGM